MLMMTTRSKPDDDDLWNEVPDDAKLITARAAARILGICESSVRILIDSGKLTAVYPMRRALRLRLQAVIEYSREL